MLINSVLPWTGGWSETLCHSDYLRSWNYWCNDPQSWTATQTNRTKKKSIIQIWVALLKYSMEYLCRTSSTSNHYHKRFITISRSEFSGLKPVGRLMSRTTILTSLGPKDLQATDHDRRFKMWKKQNEEGIKKYKSLIIYKIWTAVAVLKAKADFLKWSVSLFMKISMTCIRKSDLTLMVTW